jgi:hypothetical protein
MSEHLHTDKLELVHDVSDLVEKSGLWTEIARLGMTREFIEHHEDFYTRIIMELDFIEKRAPHVMLEARKLKSLAGTLHLQELHRHGTTPARHAT